MQHLHYAKCLLLGCLVLLSQIKASWRKDQQQHSEQLQLKQYGVMKLLPFQVSNTADLLKDPFVDIFLIKQDRSQNGKAWSQKKNIQKKI